MNSNNPKGRPKNKGIVFETDSYLIREIPLNFQIECKLTKRQVVRGVERDVNAIDHAWYSPLERGLEFAKDIAEFYIWKETGIEVPTKALA